MADHEPAPLKITRARTLLHIGGQAPVCSISISSRHVHEDSPGDRISYVAKQYKNAEFLAHAWNNHHPMYKAARNLQLWLDNDPEYVEAAADWCSERGISEQQYQEMLLTDLRVALTKAQWHASPADTEKEGV